MPARILLVSTDLMSASRLQGGVQRAGGALQVVPGADAAVAACGAGEVAAVIVDLSTLGSDVAALTAALREADPPPAAIVAFGPHVHTARLQAARDAGCDKVLSRGQLDRELDALLARYLPAGDEDPGREQI